MIFWISGRPAAPRKRNRAFAKRRAITHRWAVHVRALLVAGGFFAAQTNAVALVGLYAIVSLSYSLWLKEFPLVDIFVLAGLLHAAFVRWR